MRSKADGGSGERLGAGEGGSREQGGVKDALGS